MNSRYLKETPMLNFRAKTVQSLIKSKGWDKLDEFAKIEAVYNFVRDEIKFGYNSSDNLTAERVLQDGYGQCNTKATLLMALLRALCIPCRVHGFTVDKKLQRGVMSEFIYKLVPNNVFHSWVEVNFKGIWFDLEAVILDKKYLNSLRKINSNCMGSFCGYGVAVDDFQNPVIDWNENNTYIQSRAVNNDFGIYDSPDDLLIEHHQEMSKLKEFMYKYIGRHLMNKNVKRIRNFYTGRQV